MEYSYDLPDDLVTQILVRLPVKSLLRFKCVRRNWYSLITSSSFVTEHLHHKENPTRLLIHTCNPFTHKSIDTFVLPEKLSSDVSPVLEKPSYLQIPAELSTIVGPVDGIFLLHGGWRSKNSMALWNPATREFRPLPPYFNESNCSDQIVGFGFDSSSRDYKVIFVEVPVPSAAVYSLRTGCWRNLISNIDIHDKIMDISLCSTCVNGFYYWYTESPSKVNPDNFGTIQFVSFDMHNEVFGEIPGPDIDISCLDDVYVTLYKESLCVVVYEYYIQDRPSSIDIWLMNGQKLWNKVLNVVEKSSYYYYLHGHGFWGHDKLIIEHISNDALLYDSKTHEFTSELLFYYTKERILKWVSSYRESLVSIKSKNVSHRQGDVLDLIQQYFNCD